MLAERAAIDGDFKAIDVARALISLHGCGPGDNDISPVC
jgi:hypothetical protein